MSNLLLNASNEAYHADVTHLSSSALKLLLRSPEEYYATYIAKTVIKKHNPSYDIGSFTHSLILEPEKVATDYAIFDGLRRAGNKFDLFAVANKGKTIMLPSHVNLCERMVKNALSVPLVNELLEGGISEHTMLSTILNTPVKARADRINLQRNYIVDIKTTVKETDIELFQQTIQEYAYDLSAAFYCQIAHNNYNALFDFYFIVLSKADNGVGIYRASTATLSAGAAKVTEAIVKYKKCTSTGIWSSNQPKHEFVNTQIEILEV